MPEVRVDFRQATDGGGGYDNNIPSGYYRLKCVSSKLDKASTGSGGVIRTEWRIVGPQNVGSKVGKTFSLLPQATWSLRNMMMALGAKDVPKTLLSVNTDSFVNKECGAFIGDGEMNRNGKKTKISEVKEWLTIADYQALRVPSRPGEPTLQQAVGEAEALEADDETFEYEDPEEKKDEDEEEKAEEFTL